MFLVKAAVMVLQINGISQIDVGRSSISVAWHGIEEVDVSLGVRGYVGKDGLQPVFSYSAWF